MPPHVPADGLKIGELEEVGGAEASLDLVRPWGGNRGGTTDDTHKGSGGAIRNLGDTHGPPTQTHSIPPPCSVVSLCPAMSCRGSFPAPPNCSAAAPPKDPPKIPVAPPKHPTVPSKCPASPQTTLKPSQRPPNHPKAPPKHTKITPQPSQNSPKAPANP